MTCRKGAAISVGTIKHIRTPYTRLQRLPLRIFRVMLMYDSLPLFLLCCRKHAVGTGQVILRNFATFFFFWFVGHREISTATFDPKIWGWMDISVLHIIRKNFRFHDEV